MSRTSYDLAIIGLGAVGAMAAWRASAAGARTIAFEQFHPGDDRGSSHGHSRIFRRTLFEGPAYRPLIDASTELWRTLERHSRRTLFTRTGGLVIGHRDGELIAEALASARCGGFAYEGLDAEELAREYPQHVVTPTSVAVLELGAGVLDPELSIRAAVELASDAGVEVVTVAPVRDLVDDEHGVTVRTADGDTVTARRVIVAAGAWTGRLLPHLQLPLRTRRSCHVWFRGPGLDGFGPERFPVFMHEDDGVDLWGIPDRGGRGVKIGAGSTAAKPWLDDPDDNDRPVDERDLGPAEVACAAGIRGLTPRAVEASACMNSGAPDGDFVLGVHPEAPSLILAAGMSGHGFKHAPGAAQHCVDLALHGGSAIPGEPFSPARFGGEW